MKNTRVLTIGPNGGQRTYSSIRATARALSGTGKVTTSYNQVRAAVANGGGYVGRVLVKAA